MVSSLRALVAIGPFLVQTVSGQAIQEAAQRCSATLVALSYELTGRASQWDPRIHVLQQGIGAPDSRWIEASSTAKELQKSCNQGK